MKKAMALLMTLLLVGGAAEAKKNKPESFTRVYEKKLGSQDRKDITYVIKTLGLGGLTKILSHKSNMKKVGDRIRPVHPLKFLGFVFSQEELRACAYNIRHSNIPFVWSEFWGGLKESLNEEFDKGNVTDSQIADFSKTVGIDEALVAPLIKEQKWLEFYDLLLKELPRSENAGRYNI